MGFAGQVNLDQFSGLKVLESIQGWKKESLI